MSNLEARFRALARTRTPDLWPEVETREPRPEPGRSNGARILAVATAFAVAVAGFVLSYRAFEGGTRRAPTPAASSVSNGSIAYVSNGDLWMVEPDGSGSRRVALDVPGGVGGLTWSPDGTRFAFDVNSYPPEGAPEGGYFDIYAADADGSGVVRLTHDRGARLPSWSPDGSSIAYTEQGPEGASQIWVMNADGSDPAQLTNGPAFSVRPSWSPDGSRIAFESVLDRNSDVYVMNADGSGERRLTNDPAWDGEPVWSPDGERIAFASERGASGVYEMNADGSDQTLVEPDDDVANLGIAWSPDGRLLALSSDRGPGFGRAIYVLDPTTGELTQLTDRGPIWGAAWQPVPAPALSNAQIAFVRGSTLAGPTIPDSEIYLMASDGSGVRKLTDAAAGGKVAAEPAWSPDGSKIAFVLSTPEHLGAYAGDGGIYVMNADGTGSIQLTDGLRSAHPTWSPDGTRIAFVRNQGSSLVVMNADGSDPTDVSPEGGPYPPYQWPAWSPDGSRIAFQASPESGVDTNRVYVTELNGSGTSPVTSGLSDGYPAWSPDGTTLAYAGPDGIHLLDVGSGSERRLTECGRPQDCGFDFEPSWAPDGSRIVFERQDYGGASLQVFVVNADGTDLRQLTTGPEWNSEPTWQPTPIEESGSVTPSPAASIPATASDVIPIQPPPGSVSALTYGLGSVWVASYDGSMNGKVTRLDADTGDELTEISTGDVFPTWEVGGGDLVVGDGSVWMAGASPAPGEPSGVHAYLMRIDPTTNETVAKIDLRASDPADIAIDGAGVWVMSFGAGEQQEMEVSLIDPSTNEVVATIPLDATYGHHLFAVGGRIVAETNEATDAGIGGTVLHVIDPATAREVVTTPLNAYVWPAAGDVGTGLWEADGRGFASLDPQTGSVVDQYRGIESTGDALAVGEGGIWFLGPEGRTRVGRFDPVIGAVEVKVDLPNGTTPIAMTLSPGALWVLNYEGSITRVVLT